MFDCALRLVSVIFLLLAVQTLASTERRGRLVGNVTLGGLFPVHEYGNQRETCGAISAFRGIQRLEAMLFAIEQINNDKHLLPGITLGALIFDTCSDDNYALEQSLRFVRSRLASGTCTCVNTSTSDSFHNENVFGVVGATLSSVSVHVANLLRLFQLPQISYASTTPKLSESSFDYFARTVPSDSNQARAIVDILQRLNFTYVNTIYSHGDYGEGGFREFKRLLKVSTIVDSADATASKKKQQQICIADEQRLKRDASIQEIRGILQTMIDRVKPDVHVRVYVLFVTKEDARKLLQAVKLISIAQRPVLIASDAWGKESSVVIHGDTDEIAVGALTLELISIQPVNFDRYFNALKPDIAQLTEHQNEESQDTRQKNSVSLRNPWFNEFWEHRFGCSLASSVECRNHQLNETNWDSKLQFIVDATYVFAQALHKYFNCTSSACVNASLNGINGTKLFRLILEERFSMPDFRQIQFNSERFVPGHYRIYNYQRSTDTTMDNSMSSYDYFSVGEWKVGQNEHGQLNLDIDAIVWSDSNAHNTLSSPSGIPISRCAEPCRVGEMKQIQGESCCWVCIPCNETSIVVGTDEYERCEPCADKYYPTANRTSCYKLDEAYIELLSVQALVPISLSVIGNLLTLFVVVLFYQKRETPIVKASGKELDFIMLAGIHLCYSMTFPFLVKPHLITCVIQRLGIGLGFSMMYAALLTKTNRIARIFTTTKKQSRLRPQYISPHSQVVICSCLITIQLLLSLLWLAYEHPFVESLTHNRLIILKCHMNKHSFLFSLTYNVLLVLICTMYAIRTRKVPENFNETKFIGFTCYTTCIIWLAFLPIYFTTDETGRHQVHITTFCVTISLCATVALACLFSPKVYIILIHPEKNMRLTSQLKTQVSNFKFTSHIPMGNKFTMREPPSSDGPSRSAVSIDNEDNSQAFMPNKTVSFKLAPVSGRGKPTTNNSANNNKQKLAFKKYTYDDDDSLNSNSNQGEDIML